MFFQTMKYGFFVHYVWGGAVCAVTHNADGSRPADINELADRFDVQGFANDLAAFAVEYVIFTAFHANMNCLFPCAAMDRWLSGHTAQRDLVGDVIRAVRARGMAVLLYTHPRDGHDLSPHDQRATGWGVGGSPPHPHWPTFDYGRWNDFINDVYGAVIDRYGASITGLFIDEGSAAGDSEKVVDYPRLRHTITSRQPDILLIQNYYGNLYACDLGAKEYEYWAEFASPDGQEWPAYATMPVSTVMGSTWAATLPRGHRAVRFSAEDIFRYTVLQAGANASGGGVNWAAGPYSGGGWEDGVVETMRQVGRYVEAVVPSLKNTRPSSSYSTPNGATVGRLAWGVATQSPDGRITYLHVLTPPPGDSLILPPPSDQKHFTSAALVATGQPVVLTQTENGVTLALDGARWDPLDTVIRLEGD